MIKNATELKRANKQSGRHFFDRNTMQFFNSKIEAIYPRWYGCLFVTSESMDASDPRMFTVARAFDSGETETLSEFQQFATLQEARAFALGKAKEIPNTSECHACGRRI